MSEQLTHEDARSFYVHCSAEMLNTGFDVLASTVILAGYRDSILAPGGIIIKPGLEINIADETSERRQDIYEIAKSDDDKTRFRLALLIGGLGAFGLSAAVGGPFEQIDEATRTYLSIPYYGGVAAVGVGVSRYRRWWSWQVRAERWFFDKTEDFSTIRTVEDFSRAVEIEQEMIEDVAGAEDPRTNRQDIRYAIGSMVGGLVIELLRAL